MADAPKQRSLVFLTRCLAPFFARWYLVVFGLLAAAIVTGLLGLPLVAYYCLCALVLMVGLFFACLTLPDQAEPKQNDLLGTKGSDACCSLAWLLAG
jgi:hypothetical protein